MLVPVLTTTKLRMKNMYTIDTSDRPRHHWSLALLMGMSALAMTGLSASQASADVLNFSTNINPQLFGAAAVPVDLSTAAGAQTTLSFATAAADLVEITFSAECSVSGSVFQYGTIQIQVDPAGAVGFTPVAPTIGPDDAFCSGNGIAGAFDGYVTPSMTVVTRVPAGVHQVQVLANTVGGAAVFRLDDLSITVDN
jgi:hypothetical protein